MDSYHWIGRESDELREFDLRKLREAIADHRRKNPDCWQEDVGIVAWETAHGQA